MADAGNPDTERLIADAWKRWREADYTWDGLAKKDERGEVIHAWDGWSVVAEGDREYAVETGTGRIYGKSKQSADRLTTAAISRPATLQDYWRVDTSSGLLRTDAEMGHELVSALGQPTYHAAHLPIKYEDGTSTLKDGDTDGQKAAALNQLVLQRLKVPDAEARFDGGVWLSAPDLGPDKSEFGPIVYNNAIFNGNAIFDSSTFTGYASFRGATFTGDAWFRVATFTGDAWFSGATFTGDASFSGATFTGKALFDRATFTGKAEFQLATFTGAPWFFDATFTGYAIFESATFTGDAWFRGATFTGDAWFFDATFTGAAWFSGATFTGKALFDRATFTGVTEFSATFAGVASFDRATFKGRIKFQLAQFHSKAYFTHIPSSNWPEKTITWHASFNGAAFKDVLDFYGSGFGRLAAFDGALIDVGIRLDPVSEIEAAQTFRKERKGVLQVEKTDGQTVRGRREQRDEQLAQLERGCRVLKQEMEKQSDKQREQLLYKFELLARRAQSNLRFGEKTFSFLYDWAADYGASIIRPFIALAVVILVFTAAFTGWAFLMGGVGQGPRQVDLEHAAAQALNFALSNSFKPLSALSADAGTAGTIIDGLLNQNVWVGIGVRLVSILQSLLSVTLAFLFGLSVRRRFQIN